MSWIIVECKSFSSGSIAYFPFGEYFVSVDESTIDRYWECVSLERRPFTFRQNIFCCYCVGFARVDDNDIGVVPGAQVSPAVDAVERRRSVAHLFNDLLDREFSF